jgi:uncharacterized protein YegL
MKQFISQKARPLPVFVLADVSGSMHGVKMNILNRAIKEMLHSFAQEENKRAAIEVCIITFGDRTANVYRELGEVNKDEDCNMIAAGNTPMGQAFDLVTEIVENREIVSSRAYRPTIVLVSDGQPNDDWEGPLQELHNSERAGKAIRFAMGIGDDADFAVLNQFIADPEQKVFTAANAKNVVEFFRYVTMSVTTRMKSSSPNEIASIVVNTEITTQGQINFDEVDDIDF